MSTPSMMSPRTGGPSAKVAFKRAFVNKFQTKIVRLKEPIADDSESDSPSVKLEKKKQRKEARRQARLAREKLKKEDPFSYYFGELDPDNPDADAKKAKKLNRRSTLNLG